MTWRQRPPGAAPSLGRSGAAEAGRPPPPRRKLARLWELAFKAAAVLVGVAVGVGVFRLPAFAVSEIEVQGLHRLSEAAVLERIAVQGQNILSLPVDELQATLAEDPWIRRAEVQRSLPGRVMLRIQERQPAVAWQVGNRRFLVDRDGTVLEEAGGNSTLPLIKDLDGTAPTPGARADGEAVALALTLTEVLPQELGQRARFFEYLSYGGLVVQTEKGLRARFGDSSDFQWKLAVWKALLKEGEAKKLKVGHVDLRFGDRPFFRP